MYGEEHRLRMPSRIFGHKENDVIRESRTIRFERLHNLISYRL
jgi:hypothetical protein